MYFGREWSFQLMFITFFPSDVEKQLAVEKESLDNLRKQIEEAQKQSGKIIQPAVKLQKNGLHPFRSLCAAA